MGSSFTPPELGGTRGLSHPILTPQAADTAKEIDDSKLTPKTSGTDVSFGSLVSLSRWHPFLLTFISYARIQYWQLNDEVRKWTPRSACTPDSSGGAGSATTHSMSSNAHYSPCLSLCSYTNCGMAFTSNPSLILRDDSAHSSQFDTQIPRPKPIAPPFAIAPCQVAIRRGGWESITNPL